jgi:hypothetical protein
MHPDDSSHLDASEEAKATCLGFFVRFLENLNFAA